MSTRIADVRRLQGAADIPYQPASVDIWDRKYRLKTRDGRPIDETMDDTWKRVARALAEVEATPEKREEWYERFLWALRQGAIPAGRIISNAGAWEHKPATSTINCTVSGTIHDSMDDILRKVHEAGLTLKAGCVAPGTRVVTEHGVVPVEQAVRERHRFILSYDRERRRVEMRRIVCHMTVRVPKEENIELQAGGVRLRTSVKHPVLVWRDGALRYVPAGEVRESDALVQHRLPWAAERASALEAWFAGAHLGDGSAYERRKIYARTRHAWAERARLAGRRLVFKIRSAEREVVERYASFFTAFCGSRAQVAAACTANGTPVWDYAVSSFAVSRAAELVDWQVGAKARSLRVPSWIARHPERHFLPFLAGLIDTDGTVDRGTGAVTIATASESFARELQGLLGLFGVHGALTCRRRRVHRLNGRDIVDEGVMLKISDSAFLHRVAPFMADSRKRRRILTAAPKPSQYDRFRITDSLRMALARCAAALAHDERQRLGFYHRYHERETVGRLWLERWRARFPELSGEIDFALSLRPVERIRRGLELDETFYDFTVEGHNNYLAGDRGLLVIHNCGIGYEFSTLRPRGAYVSGAGAYTSGPLSFMDIYDRMCFTVSSAGGRRGAQMATFDVSHPDVMEFIRAKREDGRLRQFNCSLLVTEEFMEAVKADAPWPLAFPLTEKEAEAEGIDLGDPSQVIWRDWPVKEGYITDRRGRVACRIYRTIKARRLWDLIMSSTYDYAEPGFILIDRVNEMNNNWWCENIRATNPCGEQPLPPYGACWTGNMRLVTNYGVLRTEDAYALVRQGLPLEVAVDDVFTGRKTELRPCTLVQNGEREVWELRFDNGQRIELTPDHRVYTPDGWRRVDELQPGDEVHVQARELASLPLVDPFRLGALRYLVGPYAGETLVVTRQSRRRLLQWLLDELCVNYTDRAKGLHVSRHHPVMEEVARLRLEEAPREALEGYVYAARLTSASYRGRPAVFADKAACEELVRVLGRLGWKAGAVRHRKETYRVVLPEEASVQAPGPAERTLDLDFALYGWLLADGWLTDSAGLLFSDEDDVAMARLAPRFKALTGTDGELRMTYEGEVRQVYAIACYRSAAVRRLRRELGLSDFRSSAVRVPEKVWRAGPDQQASFLAAVFCADGCIDADKPSVRLVSASREWLEDIQLLLLNFGVHGTVFASESKGKAFFTLRVQQQDAYRFWRFIGFPFNTRKQQSLERQLREKQRWRQPKERHVARLAGVRPLGSRPVYDIEEPSTHTLVVNGMVVHNCLLGSVNLTRFVREPFTPRARFDWDTFREVVAVFTRMLDNVVEINGLPLEAQRREIMRKRRHGMGYLGLGSALTMLGIRYGSPESLAFTEEVTRELAVTGWRVAVELAEEKGPAPIMDEHFEVTEEMLARRPEMRGDGIRAGDRVPGRVLHARYSRYMQQLAEVEPELVERIAEVGARFTHHSSIAPTGTISLSLANNASNGIEPSFAHHYFRNVIREGRKTKERVDVYSYELLAYRHLVDPEAHPEAEDPAHRLPDYFVTADDITPREHVDIQAAAQKWIDSSISKTANVPTDYPYEDFKDIYLYAYERGLKGCTTFRFNPEAFQGVLVKEKDLAATTYRFTLEDGTVVECKGTDEVEYDGETHTAANLFDALKEGYYGKF